MKQSTLERTIKVVKTWMKYVFNNNLHSLLYSNILANITKYILAHMIRVIHFLII